MMKFLPKAILIALAVSAATPAISATVGYSLTINDPVFNSTNGDLNVPDFELTNTSTPGESLQITAFRMAIGDTSFNFDFVRNQQVHIDPGTDLAFTLDTVGTTNDHVGEDVLVYSFSGFDAGDVFRFEVDVDPDVGSPSQDFREALFPLGEVFVTFSSGQTVSQVLNPNLPEATSFALSQVAPVPLPGGMPLYLGAALLGVAAYRFKRATL